MDWLVSLGAIIFLFIIGKLFYVALGGEVEGTDKWRKND